MINLNTEAQLDALKAHMATQGLPLDALMAALRNHASATDVDGELPDSLWADLDVHALNLNLVPPEHGGDASLWPLMERVLLMEQLGHADPALALALPGPGLATPPLLALASQQQQRRLFSRFDADRPTWGGFAITEPEAGSDATALRTTARSCSGGYVLNGTKCFITNGARADFVITFATLDRRLGRFGVRAFAVDRSTPGFQVLRKERMLGLRGSQLAVLSYADCVVPEESILKRGDEPRLHDAFSGAQSSWDYFRPILSSVIVGSCARVRDELVEYMQTFRPADPRMRAANVDELIETISAKISAARLLCHRAAWKHGLQLPLSMDSSMAKAYASRIAMEIAEAILMTVGLEGLHAYPVFECFYRNAKAYDILEGTGDMQRLMITRLYQRQRATDLATAA